METRFKLIVIGGGAAGIFSALAAKEANPTSRVLLLERTAQLLSKVRISGGGRCNVTHSCFDPRQLVQNYPRGGKALIGPFSRFQPKDTIEWFTSRGVALKRESDGRMFPVTNSSQTIIDCLLQESQKLRVEIRTKQHVELIQRHQECFNIQLASGEILECESLLLATGSHPQGHAFAKSLGHTIQEPVPSLFTFNIPSFPLVDLSGISVEEAAISLVDSNLTQTGPLLITHWGFSGPAALKLSAWGARLLHEKKYQTEILINWLPSLSREQIMSRLKTLRQESPSQGILSKGLFELPKNLFKRLVEIAEVDSKKRLSEIGNEAFSRLCERLHADRYQVNGKTTHKEEFVTCGGVTLNEVDFKTMESRICKGLYFAGEILDIDAVTGGFNFQNAWTTGWLAGNAAVQSSTSSGRLS